MDRSFENGTQQVIRELILADNIDPRLGNEDVDYALANFLFSENEYNVSVAITDPDQIHDFIGPLVPIENLTGFEINGDPFPTRKDIFISTLKEKADIVRKKVTNPIPVFSRIQRTTGSYSSGD